MPPDFVSSSFISSYPCLGPLSSIDSRASRISPVPKNLPHRPPRPQGKAPPTKGAPIPPRHQLPHLPYILLLTTLRLKWLSHHSFDLSLSISIDISTVKTEWPCRVLEDVETLLWVKSWRGVVRLEVVASSDNKLVSGFHIKARTQVVSELHQPEFECQRDIAPGPPTDQVAERGRNHCPRDLFQLPGLPREFRAKSQSTVHRCLESDKETTEQLDLPSRRICRDPEDRGVRQLHAQVQHDRHSCVRDRLGADQKEVGRGGILALCDLRDASNLRPHDRSRRQRRDERRVPSVFGHHAKFDVRRIEAIGEQSGLFVVPQNVESPRESAFGNFQKASGDRYLKVISKDLAAIQIMQC